MKKYIISYKNYRFECLKCGTCCYNMLVQSNIPWSGYNYKGEFVYNPTTSIIVHYLEKSDIENTIKNKYSFQLKFHPYNVFFLKEHKVGFIYDYQIGVKKNKFCHYYNRNERKCKIYSIRPAICRYYPLTLNLENLKNPRPDKLCPLIQKKIDEDCPKIQYGDLLIYDTSEDILQEAFPEEYKIFMKTRFYWFQSIEYIFSMFQDFILSPAILTPKLVENYTLKDMSQFFDWCETNLKVRQKLNLLKNVKRKYNSIIRNTDWKH